MSGLAVSRGRVLTLVQREGKQWLVALKAQTGDAVWQTAIAPEYRNATGNSPRATPAISGDQVFVFTGERIWQVPRFGKGNLIAADGRLFITRNLMDCDQTFGFSTTMPSGGRDSFKL